MSQPQLSRRDWFRLRLSDSDSEPAITVDSDSDRQGIASSRHGLQPLEQPPNHDGMDLSQLPPISQALINGQELEDLFNDIPSLATNVTLLAPGLLSDTSSEHRTASPQHLQLALAGLLGGQLQRLQIRYTWQSAHWIDTLETKPDGYRLIRICHR
ncbi:MAG: hypothetical protein KF752_07215 [Pirellulaceae bacterium]|nr:hypothetical protein [Pirellulaceae bacterium]